MGHYRSEMYDDFSDEEKRRLAKSGLEYDRWFYHAVAYRRVMEFIQLGWEEYAKKYEVKRSQGPPNRDT